MIRRWTQAFLGVLAAATFVGPVTTSGADSDAATTLAGFQGLASASGVHALYNPEGLLPLPPPVDIGAPDAYTTIVSGPTTFARASVADPGDLVANPGAVIALLSPAAPADKIPAYPFRILATSGVGSPTAESNPAPGLNARVVAHDSDSLAQATMPALDAPAIATFGTVTALATTKTDGQTVTVQARSQTSGIDILGLVKIDSIVTDLTATSVGDGTKLSGGTKVLGATVMGQAVTIDGTGVHQKAGSNPILPLPLGLLTGTLNDQLGLVGLRITAAGPVTLAGGATGQLGSTGLRIDFQFSPANYAALSGLLNSLPPIDNPIPGAPVGIEDLLAAAKAHQLVSIEIGRGLVSLNARQTVPFDAASPAEEFPSSLAPYPLSDLSGLDLGLGVVPTIRRAPPKSVSTTSALPSAVGVGALILLALLAVPFTGELIARACGAVLATTDSETCPREEP